LTESLILPGGPLIHIRGDLGAALKLYREAEKLFGKPDDDLILALTHATEALNDQKLLKEQLK